MAARCRGALELTLGGAFDQLISTSSASLFITGGTIEFGLGAGFDYNTSYQIFEGFGEASFAALSLTGYDTSGYTASISNAGLLSFTAVAVPEPSTYAAMAGAVALGVAGWQRRRRAARTAKAATVAVSAAA